MSPEPKTEVFTAWTFCKDATVITHLQPQSHLAAPVTLLQLSHRTATVDTHLRLSHIFVTTLATILVYTPLALWCIYRSPLKEEKHPFFLLLWELRPLETRLNTLTFTAFLTFHLRLSSTRLSYPCCLFNKDIKNLRRSVETTARRTSLAVRAPFLSLGSGMVTQLMYYWPTTSVYTC